MIVINLITIFNNLKVVKKDSHTFIIKDKKKLENQIKYSNQNIYSNFVIK